MACYLVKPRDNYTFIVRMIVTQLSCPCVLIGYHSIKTHWGMEVSGQLLSPAALPPERKVLVPIRDEAA